MFARVCIFVGVLYLCQVTNLQAQAFPKRSHLITHQEALDYISKFEQTVKDPAAHGGHFVAEDLKRLLALEGCIGLSFYFVSENGIPSLMTVGVDKDGYELWEDGAYVSSPTQPGVSHPVNYETASTLVREAGGMAFGHRLTSGFFWGDYIGILLEQENSDGIKFYYGFDKGRPVIVLVGTDRKGRELKHGLWAERSITCPPFCSDLNNS